MTTLMTPVQETSHAAYVPATEPAAKHCGDATQHRPMAGWQIDRTAAGNRGETDCPATNSAVDIMALLGRCLGNFELIVRVLARFRKTGGTDIDELGHAIDRSDFMAVVAIAHRFKGAAGNISAAGLHKIAAGMEQLGRDKNTEALPGLLTQLRNEWTEFRRFADAFAPPEGVTQVHPVQVNLPVK